MKKSVISKLLTELEQVVQTEFQSGVEFWLARDLQKVSDHFTEESKIIPLGKGDQPNERSSLDCGSLLTLSARQPAASGSALARRSRTKPQSSAVDSQPSLKLQRAGRLSHGKLQQAVAVQSLQRPWTPDHFPGLRKLIAQFTFSNSHFSLATSES
jgi:hypothetical protein